jgi:RNA recognition motif-containing protein
MKIKNKAEEVPVMGQNSTDPRMIFIRNLPYKLTDPEVSCK